MSLSHIAENPDLQYHVLSRYLNSSNSDISSDTSSDTGSVVDSSSVADEGNGVGIPIPTSSSATSIPTSIPTSSSSTLSDSRSNGNPAEGDLGMQIYLRIKDTTKLSNTPPRKKRQANTKSAPFRSIPLLILVIEMNN